MKGTRGPEGDLFAVIQRHEDRLGKRGKSERTSKKFKYEGKTCHLGQSLKPSGEALRPVEKRSERVHVFTILYRLSPEYKKKKNERGGGGFEHSGAKERPISNRSGRG